MDIPSQTPDSSGHWLLGKKKSDVSVNSILGSVSMVDSEVGSLDDKQQLKEQIESQTGKEESICDKQATAFPHLTLEEAVGELPSMYFKKALEVSDSSKRESEAEKFLTSDCHSYVVGQIDSLSLGGLGQHHASDVGTSRSSTSPASTVRENYSDFPHYDSVISEPQLSSTREITDDCIVDLGLSVKRVHFLGNPESERVEISHISLESEPRRLDSLMDMPSTPYLSSTARSHLLTSTESKRLLMDQEDDDNAEENNELTLPGNEMDELKSMIEHIDQKWQRAEQEMTLHEISALTPEAWVAAFSNTSSLTTPLLMNKIKEHVLRLQGQRMSLALPSQSSGIGGSGFEITEDSRINSGSHRLSNKNSTGLHLPRDKSSYSSVVERKNSIPSMDKQAKYASQSIAGVVADLPIAKRETAVRPQVRHTLSALPSQRKEKVENPGKSAPSGMKGQATDGKTDLNENNIKLTSMVKMASSVDTSKPVTASPPNVKCSKSEVYFGGVKVRQCQKQSLIIRNSCFKQKIDLELLIKDTDSFFIVEENQSLVTRRVLQLDPRQELSIILAFQPHNLGPVSSKLNLYPRDSVNKKLKFTVDLRGYGGSSQIKILTDHLLPKLNGKYWSCRFGVENGGNVVAFVSVKPVFGKYL